MTKRAAWMTGTGKQAIVDVELVTSRAINLDGDKCTVACCEIEITAYIDGSADESWGPGLAVLGHGAPTTDVAANGKGLVARIGKLGLTAETLALVEAAIVEVKTSPEWLAQVAGQAAAIESGRRYDEHREMMRRAMAEEIERGDKKMNETRFDGTERLDGYRIEYSLDGQGHSWLDAAEHTSQVIEIECEILDGGHESGQQVMSNGLLYRWSRR